MVEKLHEQDNETVVVKVAVLKENFNYLCWAAEAIGETRTDAVNRAFRLYQMLHAATPGMTIHWKDGLGERREVLVLK